MSDNRWEMPKYENELVHEKSLEDQFLGKVLLVEPHQRAIVTVGGQPQPVLAPGRYSYDIFKKWKRVRCKTVDIRPSSFPVQIDDEFILGTDETKGVPMKRFEAIVNYKVEEKHVYKLAYEIKEPISQLFDSVKMAFSDVVTQMSYEEIRRASKANLSKRIFEELPIDSLKRETYLEILRVKVIGFTPSPVVTQTLEAGWKTEIQERRTGIPANIWELPAAQLATLLEDERERLKLGVDLVKNSAFKTLVDLADGVDNRQQLIALLEFLRPRYLAGPRGQPAYNFSIQEKKSSQLPRQETDAQRLLDEQDLLVKEVDHKRVENQPGPDGSRIFVVHLAEADGKYPLTVKIKCLAGYPYNVPEVSIEVIEEEGRTVNWLVDNWTEKIRLDDVIRQIKKHYGVE